MGLTGAFDPGDIPSLSNIGANLFNASGAAVEVTGQNLTSSLTSNFIPACVLHSPNRRCRKRTLIATHNTAQE